MGLSRVSPACLFDFLKYHKLFFVQKLFIKKRLRLSSFENVVYVPLMNSFLLLIYINAVSFATYLYSSTFNISDSTKSTTENRRTREAIENNDRTARKNKRESSEETKR